jgi:hypothetical protein
VNGAQEPFSVAAEAEPAVTSVVSAASVVTAPAAARRALLREGLIFRSLSPVGTLGGSHGTDVVPAIPLIAAAAFIGSTLRIPP